MNDLEKKVQELEFKNQELKDKISELENKYEHVKRLIGIDYLTKIPNKYAIGETLEEEVAYCRRKDKPLSLIFIDIDFFKKINTEYGHQAGDQVLAQLAARIQKSLRRYDKIGRYGGEEFIVVLRGETITGAKVVAERLRKKVADEPFLDQDEETQKITKISITISLGIAQLQRGQLAFGLIKAADEAMREAKNKGRNCIVINGTY